MDLTIGLNVVTCARMDLRTVESSMEYTHNGFTENLIECNSNLPSNSFTNVEPNVTINMRVDYKRIIYDKL